MANTPQCIYNIPCNMEIRYISSLFETWSFLSLVASYSQKKKKKGSLVASLFLLQFEFSLRDYYTQFFVNSNPNLSP